MSSRSRSPLEIWNRRLMNDDLRKKRKRQVPEQKEESGLSGSTGSTVVSGSLGALSDVNGSTTRIEGSTTRLSASTLRSIDERAKRSKPTGPGIPKKFKELVEECEQLDDWETNELLGQGEYGSVYVACRARNCNYVLKIQEDNAEFRTEVKALHELQKTKVVPKLYAAWTCQGKGFLVIQKLQKCDLPSVKKYEEMKQVLATVKEAGWLHVDTHKGNYMCGHRNKVLLFDFGWAVKRGRDGDDQVYPDHPLSKRFRFPVTWSLLEKQQEKNFQANFNPAEKLDLGVTSAQKQKWRKEWRDAIESLAEEKRKLRISRVKPSTSLEY